MRLAVHVNVLKEPDEYKEMAQLALEEKLACEAQAVLEQGFTKKVFVEKRDVDVNTRLLNAAKKEAARREGRRCRRTKPRRSAAATGDATGQGRRAVPGLRRRRQGRRSASSVASPRAASPRAIRRKAQRIDEAYMLLGIAHLQEQQQGGSRQGVPHREAAIRPWCASPSSGCSTPESGPHQRMNRKAGRANVRPFCIVAVR